MSADVQPVQVPTSATASKVDFKRGLFTARDLAFLIYYYPLRWMARLVGAPFFRVAQRWGERISPWVQARERRVAEQKLMNRLAVSLPEAQRISGEFLRCRVRAVLFVLRRDSGVPLEVAFQTVGREHLESALEQGRGVILLTVHCQAKRECAAAMQQIGRGFVTLVAGPERVYREHGRLLWKFARSRLVALQWQCPNERLVREDPDSVFEVARVLRGGGLVMMSPDVGDSATAVEVEVGDYIHRVSVGALDIARLTGCVIVPIWPYYAGRDCIIEFRKPLEIVPIEGREESRRVNTPLLVDAMAEQIREHPEQWDFWDRNTSGRYAKSAARG